MPESESAQLKGAVTALAVIVVIAAVVFVVFQIENAAISNQVLDYGKDIQCGEYNRKDYNKRVSYYDTILSDYSQADVNLYAGLVSAQLEKENTDPKIKIVISSISTQSETTIGIKGSQIIDGTIIDDYSFSLSVRGNELTGKIGADAMKVVDLPTQSLKSFSEVSENARATVQKEYKDKNGIEAYPKWQSCKYRLIYLNDGEKYNNMFQKSKFYYYEAQYGSNIAYIDALSGEVLLTHVPKK